MEDTLRRSLDSLTFVVVAGALAALCGCSSRMGQDDHSPSGVGTSDPGRSTADTGTVGVALQVASGININSVSYTLTGPNSFTQSGTIDVSMSSTVSALLGGIPAGGGYAITLSGVSTDGSTTCSGESAPFSILSNQTTPVSVALACSGGAPESGTISVIATTSQCPIIDAITINPANVIVGGSLTLIAEARGPNSAGLTFQWTATSGTLANTTSPLATFTCTSAGAPTLTLTVSDGSDAAACLAVQSVSVTCTQVDGG